MISFTLIYCRQILLLELFIVYIYMSIDCVHIEKTKLQGLLVCRHENVLIRQRNPHPHATMCACNCEMSWFTGYVWSWFTGSVLLQPP